MRSGKSGRVAAGRAEAMRTAAGKIEAARMAAVVIGCVRKSRFCWRLLAHFLCSWEMTFLEIIRN